MKTRVLPMGGRLGDICRPLFAASVTMCCALAATAADKPGDPLDESGCYQLRASSTDRYLSNQTGRLSTSTLGTYVTAFHTEDDIKPGEKFCLVEIADNRHLIVGEDNTFVTALGGDSGHVTRAWDPGPATEWEFRRIDETNKIYGIRSVAHDQWLNANPHHLYHGVVATRKALGNDERWSLFATDGCTCSTKLEPGIGTEVQVAPTTGPIVGYADTHAHTFSNRGFGGYEIHGDVFDDRYGMRGALSWCSFSHGREGAADIIGLVNHLRGHKESGFPQFDGWPYWNDLNHQHQYYKWIERAYRGGMRLQVMLAVNNELICEASQHTVGVAYSSMSLLAMGLVPPDPRDLRASCDDMASIDRQIAGAKALEKFIDAQHGGEGKGWYRIAYSAAEARRIMEGGKMAVVLGAEVDTLFGCSAAQPCTAEQVDRQLDDLYDKGIRYVFPLHVLDNAFGGAALYNPLFVAANIAKNGKLLAVETCPDPAITMKMPWKLAQLVCDLREHLSETSQIGLEAVCAPDSPSWLDLPDGPRGHCNARGLTDLGAHLVNRLMDKGMIVDVDHMSSKTLEGVLAIAEARDHPLIGGHTPFRDQAANPAEIFKSPRTIRRIHRLDGLLSPVLNSGASTADTKGYGTKVANDCPGSSKGWAQNYLYIVDRMGGPEGAAIPFGSDMNGWLSQPAPRFGADACSKKGRATRQAPRVEYPFSAHAGTGSFEPLPRGIRGGDTFDYNTYGLANVGLLPDFVQDLQNVGLTDSDLGPLFRSAEGFLQMWKKAESQKPHSAYTRVPLSGSVASFSWSDAKRHCESQSLRPATRAEICPNGANAEPLFGRMSGDVWMAVGDRDNAWISVGQKYAAERHCSFHEQTYGGKPAWGVDKGPEPITGEPAAVRCVGYTRVPIGSGSKTIYSFNWAQAKSYCEGQGMRLATRAELCPNGENGEPLYARPDGDVWLAVGDHDNAWISVGQKYAAERHCSFHEQTYGGKPAWGVDKGPEPITDEPAAVVCAAK